MVALTRRVQAGPGRAVANIKGFFVSLAQILLPVLGIYALVEALFTTGLVGFRGQIIAGALPAIGLAFFGARWLALRLLPKSPGLRGFVPISALSADRVRRYAGWLGLLWGGNRLLAQLAEFESYSMQSQAVLQFPLIVASGYVLFGLGRALRQSVQPDGARAEVGFKARAVDLAARALIGVGVAGPLVAAVGYFSAALAITYPAILTIGVLALLVVLGGLARDGYSAITGCDEDAAREALILLALNFALALLALPGLALIWGARLSDLAEIWARLAAGVQLGEARVSPADFLTFAIIFAVGYALTWLVQSTLRTSILPKTRIDPGGQTAMVSGVGYFGIFLAAVIAISTVGIDLSSLAIVAVALSVGIGFGLQNIVSNFVSGIILLIERPIAVGDWIEVGGNMGTMRSISVRSTRIETFDRTDVIIANSDLVSGTVTNCTRGNTVGRAIISAGVAYGTDTCRVQGILVDIAKAHPMVLSDPPPSVHFTGFGADSLDFQIRAILRDVNFILSVKTDIHHAIAERFARAGIEIPFAQRDIWLRNPEVLRADPRAGGKRS